MLVKSKESKFQKSLTQETSIPIVDINPLLHELFFRRFLRYSLR